MTFRVSLLVLAILATSLLAVAALLLRPQLLLYAFVVSAPCAAVYLLEGGKRRFAWIGSVSLTLSAAAPLVLAALLDPSRAVIGDFWAWAVPIGAGMTGTAIAVVLPIVGESMTVRERREQFRKIEEHQQALIAEWGEEQLREPLNPPG